MNPYLQQAAFANPQPPFPQAGIPSFPGEGALPSYDQVQGQYPPGGSQPTQPPPPPTAPQNGVQKY